MPIAWSACTEQPQPKPSQSSVPGSPLRVVATIPPLGGIVGPLLTGSKLPHELTTLVPPGASEHGFEIPPEKLAALGKADIVVMAGLGMEPQVEKFLADHPNPARLVVNCAEVLKIKDEGAHDHGADTNEADDHHHHGADPHVWLDPLLVREALTACAGAIRSKAAGDIDAKLFNAVVQLQLVKIDGVHHSYEAALSSAPRRTIVVAHDAYDYLANRYTLEVIAITGLNAGEPRPADLKRAADAVREHHLTTIFVEPQLSSAAADRLAAATGAKIAVLDPLGDGDWFKLMDKNLRALKDALGVPPSDAPKPAEKPR